MAETCYHGGITAYPGVPGRPGFAMCAVCNVRLVAADHTLAQDAARYKAALRGMQARWMR